LISRNPHTYDAIGEAIKMNQSIKQANVPIQVAIVISILGAFEVKLCLAVLTFVARQQIQMRIATTGSTARTFATVIVAVVETAKIDRTTASMLLLSLLLWWLLLWWWLLRLLLLLLLRR